MRGAGGSLVAAVFALILAGPTGPAGAELFVSPGIEGVTGYTSNRYQEPDARGSAFTRVSPSLELTAFGDGGAEGRVSLRYDRTDYLRSGASRIQQASAEAGLTWDRPGGTWSVALSGGTYEDGAVPEDDLAWIRFEPGFARPLLPWLSGSLGLSVTGTRYDSRQTGDGDRQVHTLWELRPGLSARPRPKVTLWAQGLVQAKRSNEPTEEWNGGGLSVGGDWVVGGRARVGIHARWQTLRYTESADDGSRRRDTPVSVGAWGAVRLAPWAELTASAGWTDSRSTSDPDDYTAWNAQAGVRLVYDWQTR